MPGISDMSPPQTIGPLLGKPLLRAEIAGVFGLADRAAVASE